MDFESMKSGFFGEMENMDRVVEYASSLAGPAGVTAAMVSYNTLLQKLSEAQQKQNSIKDDAEYILSVVLSCGRHLVDIEEYGEALEYLRDESQMRTNLDFEKAGESFCDVVLRLDNFASNRMRIRDTR